jgi:hypothetical protein
LLGRFGVTNESLVGDLMEEYEAGRSAAWYWWQTLSAIARTVTRDVWHHKLLAGRAVIVGWLVAFPFAATPGPIMNLFKSPPMGVKFLLACFGFALAGWVVARTHRQKPAAMVLAFAASFLVAAFIDPGSVNPMFVLWIFALCTLLGGFLQAPGALDDSEAEWLLRGFGVSRRAPALAGGTLKVIAGTAARDLWHHKLLTLRAIVMGYILLLLVCDVNNKWSVYSLLRSQPWMQTRVWGFLFECTAGAFIGWLIARAHRRFPAAMVMAFITTIVMPLVPRSCAESYRYIMCRSNCILPRSGGGPFDTVVAGVITNLMLDLITALCFLYGALLVSPKPGQQAAL